MPLLGIRADHQSQFDFCEVLQKSGFARLPRILFSGAAHRTFRFPNSKIPLAESQFSQRHKILCVKRPSTRAVDRRLHHRVVCRFHARDYRNPVQQGESSHARLTAVPALDPMVKIARAAGTDELLSTNRIGVDLPRGQQSMPSTPRTFDVQRLETVRTE